MKKIAVLMSTYNGELFIREQIDSILHQNCELSIDLWVRDDGSTDKTKTILEEYALQAKLKWYTGPNLGPAHSFLNLIQQCPDYDYYAFSDQDDYWMADKLESAINTIKATEGPALYCSNAELVNEELISLQRTVYRQAPKVDFYTVLCAGGLLGCTMVFNESLARFIQNQKEPEYVCMHDFYVAALCAAINGKILYDNTSHIKYRQHKNNVIGVPHGLRKTLQGRFSSIIAKSNVSIAEQADTLLRLYTGEIKKEKQRWLCSVASYRINFFSRLALALSLKIQCINVNMGIKIRMAILLGNR